jgi:hypothetical protein
MSGQFDNPIYVTWQNMRQRCYNSKHPSYQNYGGRGIKVCKRWRRFENFSLDMGDRPKGTSLERINVNRDYRPSNCRWATRRDQQNNRRDNRILTYKGITKPISFWADEVGIKRDTLRCRLRYGWSVEKTLETPVGV